VPTSGPPKEAWRNLWKDATTRYAVFGSQTPRKKVSWLAALAPISVRHQLI